MGKTFYPNEPTYYGLVLMLVCVGVRAYPDHVPTDSCTDMFPTGHVVEAQTSTPPFELLVSASSYTAGSTITVTLNTTDPSTWHYVGMFVQARRATDCRQRTPVGTFSFASGDTYLQTMKCSATGDAITHKISVPTLTKVFTWTAPSTPVGHVYFRSYNMWVHCRATVVNDFVTFWTDVVSDLVRGPKAAAPPATWMPCAAKQDHTDVTPDNNTDVTPDNNTDVTPDNNTDVTPDNNTDVTPDNNTDVTPDNNTNVTPDNNTNVTPDNNTNVTPDNNTDVTPDNNTDVTPDNNTDVTPDNNTDVTPDNNTNVTPDNNTDVTPDNNTNVTPDNNTDVTPDNNTDVTPDNNTNVTPDNNTDVTPDNNTNVTPDNNTDVTPDNNTNVTPDNNTNVTPDNNTDVTPANAASPLYPHVLPLVGVILVALLAL